MLFNSQAFGIFFVLVFCAYWAMRSRPRVQNVLLLLASYVFYGWWDVRFLFLIILATTIDYNIAPFIHSGYVSWRQRLKSSLILIGAGTVFAGLNWEAVETGWVGLQPVLSVDWGAYLQLTDIGRYVVPGVLLAVAVANVAYYPLTRLPTVFRRRAALTASIVANLSILGFFKYFNFFAGSLAAAVETTFGYQLDAVTLNIVLPVGISFYHFQSMSYTIDTYRGDVTPTRSFVTFGTFIAFFPQLVAGPIERASRMIPQYEGRRHLTAEYWREGVWLLIWGLFKKVVVADNMASIANAAFGPYDGGAAGMSAQPDGLYYWVGLWAFTFQIYGDFSGYSDIARGVGRLLGFDLMRNFNLPYFALNPSDFWRRWHISLSTWLRDYLYIPLGGNRYGTVMTYRNLCLTMLLGGLWHGAAWTFVLWGAYHGFLLTIYRVVGFESSKKLATGQKVLAWFVMFQATCLGWLIFRARNLETVWIFLQGMFTEWSSSPDSIAALRTLLYFAWFLILMDVLQYLRRSAVDPLKGHWFYRLNVYTVTVLSLLVLSYEGSQEFIYFAF